jgi:hypothetical protein
MSGVSSQLMGLERQLMNRMIRAGPTFSISAVQARNSLYVLIPIVLDRFEVGIGLTDSSGCSERILNENYRMSPI